MASTWRILGGLLCTTIPVLGATTMVDVGPNGDSGLGMVVVQPAGSTTTSTTLPAESCTHPRALAKTRAQIAAACDCGAAETHRAYVRCAAHVVRRAMRAGKLPETCRDSVMSCAARSTCGRPGFVTCCRTTAAGVQTCRVKGKAAACRRPSGGSACVGDQESCCDACGGPTCPLPSTTTTLHPRTSTTTTTVRESCFLDVDCHPANLCDGLPFCSAGLCFAASPKVCPDGAPALWVGTANTFAGSASIAITACGDNADFSGTLGCQPGFAPCSAGQITFFGTFVISVDGVTIVINPFGFADGSRCSFDGQLVGVTMSGTFRCFDGFGFTVSTGTWHTTRCPAPDPP